MAISLVALHGRDVGLVRSSRLNHVGHFFHQIDVGIGHVPVLISSGGRVHTLVEGLSINHNIADLHPLDLRVRLAGHDLAKTARFRHGFEDHISADRVASGVRVVLMLAMVARDGVQSHALSGQPLEDTAWI